MDERMLMSWMHAYGECVFRSAYLLLHDHHLAEDISQETFLQAFRKASSASRPQLWQREVRVAVPALIAPVVAIAFLCVILAKLPALQEPRGIGSGWEIVPLDSGYFTAQQLTSRKGAD